ncbi:hypothetical protein, partial [Helicobacter sp. T3_23-1056]
MVFNAKNEYLKKSLNERERESNSALKFSTSTLSNRKTHKATSLIADNDATSVIASERSERGNPQCNTESIDCHALDSAKMQNLIARNDDNVKSCNDRVSASLADLHTSCPPSLAEGARGWVSCHTERSEVSQN